jgi:hypothetical protein
MVIFIASPAETKNLLELKARDGMGERKGDEQIKVKNNEYENIGVDEIEFMSEWYQSPIIAYAFVIKYDLDAVKQ